MSIVITKDDNEDLYTILYAIWIQEKRPGWVNHGNKLYRVLHPSDEDIRFESLGTQADMYEHYSKGIN